MEKNQNYLVLGNRPWSAKVFDEVLRQYPGNWYFINTLEELTLQVVEQCTPRYLFFLHWSWRVPEEIVNRYECVCFHMTDLPFGRGGTPLQNLILRGFRKTKLSAFRMTSAFDDGPVYMKEELSLEGSASEIYQRANNLSTHMIQRLIEERPIPVPQVGEVVIFQRRKPDESVIPSFPSIEALYDFIRMLDAEGYPKASIHWNGFCYEFSEARLKSGVLQAYVTITPQQERKK